MAVLETGSIELIVGGRLLSAKGSFTCNAGTPMREPVYGANQQLAAFKRAPQDSSVEGAITLQDDFDQAEIQQISNQPVTVRVGNRAFVLRDASYVGEGPVTTDEMEMSVKFVGVSGTWV